MHPPRKLCSPYAGDRGPHLERKQEQQQWLSRPEEEQGQRDYDRIGNERQEHVKPKFVDAGLDVDGSAGQDVIHAQAHKLM